MSETPPRGMPDEPDDPGDAAVPDYAGELDHEGRHRPGVDDPGSPHDRVGARGLVVLGVIVVLVGGVALWAVLSRGPGSRPTATTTAAANAAAVDPAALFAQNCATCHGPQGAGLPGGTAPVLAGSGLVPQAVAATVIDGAPGMPSFRNRLSDMEVAALAAYVSALSGPG